MVDHFAWGQQILYVEVPAIPEQALLPPADEEEDEVGGGQGDVIGDLPLSLKQLFTRWRQLLAVQHEYAAQALREPDLARRAKHLAQAERHEMLAEWAKQTFSIAVCEHFELYGRKRTFLVKPSWEVISMKVE